MSINVIKNITDKTLNRVMEEVQNPITKYAIYDALARYCDPYVPMKSGNLAQTTEIYPSGEGEGLHYTQPYAHYQYVGEVYGPNYPIKEGGEVVGFFTNPYGKKAPIIEGGTIVGWYSPPNKQPTGRKISYKTDYHPLATSHWDQAMMRDKGDEFKAEVKDIIEEFIRRTENGKR